jgi:hypothetical protein
MFTAKDVDRGPGLWSADGAMNFFDFWRVSVSHRAPGHPVSLEVFVSLCFEETACSNVAQGGKPIALGPGQLQVSEDDKVYFFAGVSIVDPSATRDNFLGMNVDSSKTTWAVRQDKTVYMRDTAMFPKLPPLAMKRVLADNDFAIKMHWRYWDWLRNGNGRSQKPVSSVGGLLDAQTGGNKKANDAFIAGGAAIRQALDNGLDWSQVAKLSDSEKQAYVIKRRAEVAAAIQVGAIGFRGKDAGAGVKYFPKFWEFFLPAEGFLDPLFSFR